MLILATVFWVVAKSVRPEVVKEYINSQITHLTAQNSQVNGDISWHLFPRPGITLTAIEIGDLRSHDALAMKIDNLLFNLKITPLLRGKLVFSELKMNGFTIQINSESEHSTTNLATAKTVKKEEVSETFAIENLMLSKGRLIWMRHDDKLVVSNLQIGAEQFNLDQSAFPFQLKGMLEKLKANQSQAQAHINFKGNTRLSPALLHNPQHALKMLLVNGQLNLSGILIKKLQINQLSANTQFKEGKLRLNPLALKLYKGESVGDLEYDLTQQILKINQTGTNIDNSKVMQDLFTRKIATGRLDFSLHTQTDLNNPSWQTGTRGNGNFTIKDGALLAINFNKAINDTDDKISKLLDGHVDKSNQKLQADQFGDPALFRGDTPFKLLGMDYKLENDLLLSDSLVLQTDNLQLKGSGQLNLNDRAVNAHLQAKVTFNNKQTEKIQQLLGGSIPFQVKGTLDNPIVIPEIDKINPFLTQLWLKANLEKPVKAIKQQLQDLLP